MRDQNNEVIDELIDKIENDLADNKEGIVRGAPTHGAVILNPEQDATYIDPEYQDTPPRENLFTERTFPVNDVPSRSEVFGTVRYNNQLWSREEGYFILAHANPTHDHFLSNFPMTRGLQLPNDPRFNHVPRETPFGEMVMMFIDAFGRRHFATMKSFDFQAKCLKGYDCNYDPTISVPFGADLSDPGTGIRRETNGNIRWEHALEILKLHFNDVVINMQDHSNFTGHKCEVQSRLLNKRSVLDYEKNSHYSLLISISRRIFRDVYTNQVPDEDEESRNAAAKFI